LNGLLFRAAQRSDGFNQLVVAPLKEKLGDSGSLVLVATAVVGLLIGLLILRWITKSENALVKKVRPMVESFGAGLKTAYASKDRWAILWSTLAIWLSYVVMTYLPFHMLDQVVPYDLDLGAGLVILCMGAVGFVIPAPGGIGSYHFFVIQGLVLVYGFSQVDANIFAILTHAGNMFFLSAGGFLSLILQGSSIRAVTAQSSELEKEMS